MGDETTRGSGKPHVDGTMEAQPPVRVFISYSHDSEEHRQAVLDLANRLRVDGIDAWIDRYDPSPSQGWPRWMARQVEESKYILLVCTETYKRRFEGRETLSNTRGVAWEGLLAMQVLYDAGAKTEKLFAVLLDGGIEDHIPLSLKPFPHFRVPSAYEALYRHLTSQPEVLVPQLGQVRTLSIKAQETTVPARPVLSDGLLSPSKQIGARRTYDAPFFSTNPTSYTTHRDHQGAQVASRPVGDGEEMKVQHIDPSNADLIFTSSAQKCQDECQSLGWIVGVIVLDLDGFAALNRSHGMEVGDRVIAVVIQIIEGQSCRGIRAGYRMGSDEFVLFGVAESKLHWEHLAVDLFTAIVAWQWDGVKAGLYVSASLGISTTASRGTISAVKAAWIATHQAKRIVGRPKVCAAAEFLPTRAEIQRWAEFHHENAS